MKKLFNHPLTQSLITCLFGGGAGFFENLTPQFHNGLQFLFGGLSVFCGITTIYFFVLTLVSFVDIINSEKK